MHEHALNASTPARASLRRALLANPKKVIASLAVMATTSSLGVAMTGASFNDQVTMAQVSASSGTIDFEANNDADDTAAAWSGTLSASVTGMVPGDEATGTVNIENAGTQPFTITASTTGGDAAACFVYYFRETAVVAGATAAAAWPVNVTSMGTSDGSDTNGAAFASSVTSSSLPDNGVDMNWEADDEKTYTLTIRLKSGCTTQGASGTLNFTFDATQV